MKTRLVWIDSGDSLQAEAVLEKVRERCPDYDWIKFDESAHDSDDDAKADFLRYMESGALFGDGRVVFMRRAPSSGFSTWLADRLPCPAPNVLVVLAPSDKKNPVYAKAKKQGKDWAVISESTPLTRGNAGEWVVKRASQIGTSIEEVVARMLVDKVGTDKDRLTMELRKLSWVSNPIVAWAVEQLSFGDGQGDVKDFLNALAKEDGPLVHELLDRLLAKGDWPMGAICDWLRKMCIAESCDARLDDDTMKKVAALRKPAKDGGTKPLFANPRALYYACKEIRSKPPGWAYEALADARGVQVALRTARSPGAASTILHVFVERLLCQGK